MKYVNFTNNDIEQMGNFGLKSKKNPDRIKNRMLVRGAWSCFSEISRAYALRKVYTKTGLTFGTNRPDELDMWLANVFCESVALCASLVRLQVGMMTIA